jgi:CRISPR-associated protein Csm5
MSHIKIETLTPVHVGSGRLFQGNFEYLFFRDERKVAIIDEHKVFNIIGHENLDKWLSVINKEENLLEYLQQRSPDVRAEDTALRVLKVQGIGPAGKNTIREFMHTGTGYPILPGSSLKGSIRTALFTQKLLSQPTLVAQPSKLKNFKGKFDDGNLDKLVFGDDPNHDYLRLLRVSDVAFDETVCVLSETLNLKYEGYEMKNEVKQFTECLPQNSTGIGRLQVPEKLIREIEKRQYIRKDFAALQMPALFQIINQHTRRLLQQELKHWQEQVLPSGAELFVEKLQELSEQIEKLQPNECILRLGFGAGYNFMTGGWQQELLNEHTFTEVANAARRKDYGNVPFPKSRKMMLNGHPMGFIKITGLNPEEYASAMQEQEQRKTRKAAKAMEKAEKLQRQTAAAEALRIQQGEEALRQAEEAKKPAYYTGKIKAGVKLDAEFVKTDPINLKVKIFKLLIEAPGKEQLVKLTYASALEPGMVAVVKVQAEQKGKVQSIAFIRDKSR